MEPNYRYIGKSIPRIDGFEVVTGRSEFVADLKFSNLLVGKVMRSPHPHAIIKKIDTSKAYLIKGIKAVITHETAPDWKFGNPPVRLLDKKVRYVGDPVALIAAENERIAEKAMEVINVEYETLPAVFDECEAIKPEAPQLYENLPGNQLPLTIPGRETWATEIVTGDVEKGFAEADAVTEGSCKYHNIPNPLPIESPVAVASWNGPDMVTLWVSNQFVGANKLILSKIFGDQVRVRVIAAACGGSFGSKHMSWQMQCYAAALSRAVSQPVKVSFSKEEHLACFVLRLAARLNAKVGMKKDGTVTAVAGSWLLGTGNYSHITQIQMSVGCGEAMLAVRSRNWYLKPTIVCTNRIASGIVRGFGGQELKCTLFPVLSRAMAELSLDPFDVLKKNFVKPGTGYFWRDAIWYNYRGIDFSRAMDQGAKAFGWKEKWKGWLRPTAVQGSKRIGIGVGVHGNADIGEHSSEAYVRVDTDGRVIVHTCLTEHGTGQRSNVVKMVAEILQLPLETVSITPGDTMITPFEPGPAGSRGTYAILSAVIAAADDAKRQLFERAVTKLEATSSEDLETADGFIWRKSDPRKRVQWRQVLNMETILGQGRYHEDFTLSNCLMSFVELQIDIETGKVDLLQVVNATDVGKVIDPQGLENQLNGCLGTAGIDSALFEETIVDPTTGCILNSNMIDYKWRTTAELPVIRNVVLETPIDSHRFYAVGVGEISTAPGPSAVLMAASNAIGQWLNEYPLTPMAILKALGNT